MTQVKGAQSKSAQVAWRKEPVGRTLAQRRADFEAQMRRYVDDHMALTDLSEVRTRLQALRKRADLTQQEVANELDVAYRTFQSWDNGEVETTGENYDRLATFYSKRLNQKITRNYILFGQDKAPPLPSVPSRPPSEEENQLNRIESGLGQLEDAVVALRAELLAELGAVRSAQEAQPSQSRPAGRSRATEQK